MKTSVLVLILIHIILVSGFCQSEIRSQGKHDNYKIVQKKNGQLMGIDKNGAELFEIFWFDNGPDYIKDGLFRIIKEGKIGYADTLGRIVIEPQYDCAFPFEDGKARVSKDCKSVDDGEYMSWISQNWIFIDKKGQVIQ